MSADTTNAKVESTTEKTQDVKPALMNNQNNQKPQGGFRRGGGGGGDRGGGPSFNRGGMRRPNTNPYPKGNEDKKRFRPNFQGGGGGPGGGGGGGGGPENNIVKMQERMIKEKLSEVSGPTVDLPQLNQTEKKFSSRSRLYIGNLSPEVTDAELTDIFKKYGEVNEIFINKEKHFGFIRFDYHFNAEKAKNELNGTALNGKTLKIRFAPNGSTIKVKNLDEFVTNELLHAAFSIFGEVERCVVVVDDRGKPLGEGIVEYSRKNGAMLAIRKCTENCFFLTSTLRPVLVEMYEANDDIDGHSERFINKKHHDFYNKRSVGPRFAKHDSFEHEYGLRWKNLYEMYNQKVDNLKKELQIDQEKLVAQMELARYEHETAMLRDQLRAREMDMDRQKKEWEMKEQQADEARRVAEQEMRQQEQEMQARMIQQDEDMRRRQEENKLFMQAQQLDNMLNHQEQAYEQDDTRFEMNDQNRYEHDMRRGGGYQNYQGGRGNGRWNDNRNDYYKRRHY
ncbi:PREDICTED: hrp65 protein-like [Nicrophorus vespilloides]|uniref:Hrp65 protein-like n=1 Tax=Nicrophorus vespilloides TaxID=110193 RepID=A0ABM1M0Z1_NICVS|nr:PREDICTED: hrp65 protein-like [Nicrophorus vespilloides]